MALSPEVVVRRCESADVDLITAQEPPGRQYASITFARQGSGRCQYLVAWSGELPVGSGELEWGGIPELKNLQVRPSQRGRGTGSLLIGAAEREAVRRGFTAMRLGVAEDNEGARRLYHRLGYRDTGVVQTVSYEYVDDAGILRCATETDREMSKDLGSRAPGPSESRRPRRRR